VTEARDPLRSGDNLGQRHPAPITVALSLPAWPQLESKSNEGEQR